VTAPVRIDAAAWGDLRFATLARLCGFADAEHALIKCAKIWSWQTEHYTDTSPTYVVDPDLVESALGPGGADHLVRARLAEEGPDGLRIRGSKGRIEWLAQRRNASRRGGEATKRKRADETWPDGLPTAQPEARPEVGPNQGPLTLSLPPDQRSDSPAPARVIGQGSSWQKRQDWWACMRDAHRRLRDRGILPNAPDLPNQCAGVNEANMLACERSLREAGDDAETIDRKMRHVVLVVEAECVRDNTLRYFKPALIWAPERFNRAVDTAIAEAAEPRAMRAGPKRAPTTLGSATPRTDHGDEMRPASEVM